jgi:hypothetical protein
MAGDAAQAQRVTVGRRLGSASMPTLPPEPPLFSTIHLLAAQLLHLGAEDAGQRVGSASGGKGLM